MNYGLIYTIHPHFLWRIILGSVGVYKVFVAAVIKFQKIVVADSKIKQYF